MNENGSRDNESQRNGEWEYEYDENEFEEHLVKLDLTTFRPAKVSTSSTDGSNTIQIRDLHTTEPLILYDGVLYRCEWGSTLGTDMFVGESDAIGGALGPRSPRTSTHSIGITGSVLTARPAQARSAGGAAVLTGAAQADSSDPKKSTVGSRGSTDGQAAFLAGLTAIQEAKKRASSASAMAR